MRRGRGVSSVLVLSLLAWGCGDGESTPRANTDTRLLIIGVDGAEWDEMLPLMAAGELPNFTALAREGYAAHLTTFAPALSPVVWTSIATGKAPAKHGILGFLARDPATGEGYPVTSNMRRAGAMWNILGEAGVDVGVVGWWLTWPAEKVNGWMVSPYAAPGQTTWKGTIYAEGREDQTWPPDLLPRIAPEIEAGVEEANGSFHRQFPVPEDMELPEYLRAFLKDSLWVHVSDVVFLKTALKILEEERPRFMAAYLGGVDVTGHRFYRFSHPEEGDWETTARQREVFGPALAASYRWTDEAVGRLLAAAGPETTVLVVSDHGMNPVEDKNRPATEWNLYPHEISGGHTGGPPGILLISGPQAARNFDPGWWDGGETLPVLGSAAHPAVVDITPSMLHLFGLPVGRDMDGRVLRELFSAELAARAPEWIDSWDDPDKLPDPSPISSPRMNEVKDRLKGLGYID